MTFASCQTVAPCSAALSSIILSNFAALDLPRLAALVRVALVEEERLASLPLAVTNCTLYFLTKSLSFSFGSMPSRSKVQ